MTWPIIQRQAVAVASISIGTRSISFPAQQDHPEPRHRSPQDGSQKQAVCSAPSSRADSEQSLTHWLVGNLRPLEPSEAYKPMPPRCGSVSSRA
jgi:hypothetical protein